MVVMSGYNQKILKLVWPEDDERHGLEVRVMRMSIDDILTVATLGQNTEDTPVDRLTELVERSSRMLVSWNLNVPKRNEDGSIVVEDDEPVMERIPANAAGLRRADPTILYAIVAQATEAMVGVRPPLPRPSADGEPSLEASIPMETLSESLPSLPEPD